MAHGVDSMHAEESDQAETWLCTLHIDAQRSIMQARSCGYLKEGGDTLQHLASIAIMPYAWNKIAVGNEERLHNAI